MVQDCVFAQSSEFQFGVRSKTKLTLVQRIHNSELRTSGKNTILEQTALFVYEIIKNKCKNSSITHYELFPAVVSLSRRILKATK